MIRDAEHVEQTFSVYPSKEELFKDIIAAYRQVIKELYDAGCRLLQIDDCTWGVIVDDNVLNIISKESGLTPEELRRELKREDLTGNTHVCRGNFHSTWASSGGYDSVSDALFEDENVHAYYLEYDTDRAGDFKPLAKVSDGKKVVLGLLTSNQEN